MRNRERSPENSLHRIYVKIPLTLLSDKGPLGEKAAVPLTLLRLREDETSGNDANAAAAHRASPPGPAPSPPVNCSPVPAPPPSLFSLRSASDTFWKPKCVSGPAARLRAVPSSAHRAPPRRESSARPGHSPAAILEGASAAPPPRGVSPALSPRGPPGSPGPGPAPSAAAYRPSGPAPC